MRKVAVVGGGASGIMAAITAADHGAEVTLYEKKDRVGKKILSTGNGKCNFSNKVLDDTCYYGGDPGLRAEVLKNFDAESAVSFFEGAGMFVKNRDGYLYPASGQASTVLDILRMKLREKNVRLLAESRVVRVGREKNNRISVERTDGCREDYDSVIIACGGMAAPGTGSDGDGYRLAEGLGHTIVPVVPALVQLLCRADGLKTASGVRQDAAVSLYVDGALEARELGEIQMTDCGVSGIVVFQLSRIAGYALREKKQVQVYIDFFPMLSDKEYREKCAERMERLKHAEEELTVEEFFTGMLNKKLMRLLIASAGLKAGMPCLEADRKKMEKVFMLCRSFALDVTGSKGFESAQVCAGGVPLSELTGKLESKKVPGVYFAGELLDVDGKCGGYNLQWAWASGYTAGRAAASRGAESGEEA